MDASIQVITVIFNTEVSSISAFKSLIMYKDSLKILVFDNSNDDDYIKGNCEFCNTNGLQYLGFGENLGLSKAYNIAIHFVIEKCSSINWIVILDQDTIVPDSYLKAIKLQTGRLSPNQPIILYPEVHTIETQGDKQISPRKVFHRRDVGAVYINSGMVISRTIFSTVQYCELMFVDYVDFDFILQVRKKYQDSLQEILLDVQLLQDFSGAASSSKGKDFFRFSLFVCDSLFFRKEWVELQFDVFFFLIKRCLRLSVFHHSHIFIKEIVRQFRTIQKKIRKG